jgi:hypothetical protein
MASSHSFLSSVYDMPKLTDTGPGPTVSLQTVIDYVERLGRTTGIDFSPVLGMLYTDVRESTAHASKLGVDLRPLLNVLMGDAFSEMKAVLDSEQGPEGLFAPQRDPVDVLADHRNICGNIERLYRAGNLERIAPTEQSFQQQCLTDVLDSFRIWQAMCGEDVRTGADIGAVLAAVRGRSDDKLDAAVAGNADQVIAATADCAQVTAALAHLDSAMESIRLARGNLAEATGVAGPDSDDFMAVIGHLRASAEKVRMDSESVIQSAELRRNLVDSLKGVLACGVSVFLRAYHERFNEKEARKGRFRSGLLRLAVHARSYYEHVSGRYVAALDKLHQDLVAAEEDAAQVNNPRQSQRGATRKALLLEDIADLGKRIDHAHQAIEKLTAVVRHCGGEEQARLVLHEANGQIRCLEAAPRDMFQPTRAPTLERLTLEEIASDRSEVGGSEAAVSEVGGTGDFEPRESRVGGYYVEDRHINRTQERDLDAAGDFDTDEYNIVA